MARSSGNLALNVLRRVATLARSLPEDNPIRKGYEEGGPLGCALAAVRAGLPLVQRMGGRFHRPLSGQEATWLDRALAFEDEREKQIRAKNARPADPSMPGGAGVHYPSPELDSDGGPGSTHASGGYDSVGEQRRLDRLAAARRADDARDRSDGDSWERETIAQEERLTSELADQAERDREHADRIKEDAIAESRR